MLKEIRQLRDIPKTVEEQLKEMADSIMRDAISRAPKKSGALTGSAYVNKVDNGWVVGFGIKYAPYVEFGAGNSFVEIPTGFEDFAMQFFVDGSGHVPAQPLLLS